jgi:hypothetical protein
MKKTIRNASKPILVSGAIAACLLSTGCEVSDSAKQAIHESLMEAPSPTPTLTDIPPTAGSSSTPACYTDRYQQPAEQILHSVDILFIADTSGSMQPERAKVADALYAFVGALPAGTDYRIGVILAHGSNDPNSGRLYTYSNSVPKVLNSSTQSAATIQSTLKEIMLAAPDYGSEEGEMGSYALLKALSPARLSESRALGFFRQDAALAIVTISDENDICAIYPNPLPADFTLTGSLYPSMPGMTSSEKSIRQRDCKNGISSNEVINAIKTVQGERPFVLGAVVHPQVNFKNSGGNDSYGWGYVQTVDQNHGVIVDIRDASFTSGLSKIGYLTTTKITLLSEFTLTRENVNPESIEVLVDRNLTQFDYNADQNEVHLFDLGHALSEIDVNYCLKAVGPSPTPSTTPPSPSVSPSPSPSVSPSPSPSVSPSPSPSVSPSSSPSPTPSPSPSPTPSPSPSVTPSPEPSASPSPSPTSCTGPFCGGIIGT